MRLRNTDNTAKECNETKRLLYFQTHYLHNHTSKMVNMSYLIQSLVSFNKFILMNVQIRDVDIVAGENKMGLIKQRLI